MNEYDICEFEVLEEAIKLAGMEHYDYSSYKRLVLQYCAMSRGEDGGTLNKLPEDWVKSQVDKFKEIKKPTIRSYRYPKHPDSFFRDVLKKASEIKLSM